MSGTSFFALLPFFLIAGLLDCYQMRRKKSRFLLSKHLLHDDEVREAKKRRKIDRKLRLDARVEFAAQFMFHCCNSPDIALKSPRIVCLCHLLFILDVRIAKGSSLVFNCRKSVIYSLYLGVKRLPASWYRLILPAPTLKAPTRTSCVEIILKFENWHFAEGCVGGLSLCMEKSFMQIYSR